MRANRDITRETRKFPNCLPGEGRGLSLAIVGRSENWILAHLPNPAGKTVKRVLR